MINKYGATPWYSLNIQGEGTIENPVELPSSTMAARNKRVAEALKARTPGASARYYQLGNELDRSHYQWSHDKYVSRSRDTINAISAVDPNARFVPFLREFNWSYRYGKTGRSYANQFIADVLQGLPMVRDFSLHYYYDGKTAPTEKYWSIPEVLKGIEKGLGYAKTARPGVDFNVWITEHAKRVLISGGTPEPVTRLDSALATGDFLIALMQYPEVKGAGAQGLQGTPRRLLFKDLVATPQFMAISVLEAQPYPRVLSSKTYSPNSSGYPGGYDVRAVGFTNSSGTALSVSAVNRATKATSLQIEFAPFSNKTVGMRHYYVAGPAGVQPLQIERNYLKQMSPSRLAKQFNSSGKLTVTLPPASVSTIVFE